MCLCMHLMHLISPHQVSLVDTEGLSGLLASVPRSDFAAPLRYDDNGTLRMNQVTEDPQ